MLEIDIFEAIGEVSQQRETMLSGIHVNQFYGIEIDEFAREVAILSLWLVAHQMNVVSRQVMGSAPATLPLEDSAHITCGNATRIDWEDVCEIREDKEIFILGNPPYAGARTQTPNNKLDTSELFGEVKGKKNLDYISCWFYIAANYLRGKNVKSAFVSTNSICQGEQVSILWPNILINNVEIGFAHQPFKWTNNARDQAGVTCVIIGLRNESSKPRIIYNENTQETVKSINAYLVDNVDIYVTKRRSPLSEIPPCNFGNMPNDGGNLILTDSEYSELILVEPKARKFMRPLMGTDEFLYGRKRWCIWIEENDLQEAERITAISNRIHECRSKREASDRPATQALAAFAHRFGEVRHKAGASILIPLHTSERREYIPIGVFSDKQIITNSAIAVYGAAPWLLGIVSSKLHMVWVRSVAGGLETRIRYSSAICYNNFPIPKLRESQKKIISDKAFSIVSERESQSEKTIADLYDPDKMPDALLTAHQELDAAVEKCYRSKPFTSDEERLEHLFKLYEEMTESEPCLI